MEKHPFVIHRNFVLPLIVGLGQFSGVSIVYLGLMLTAVVVTLETRFQKSLPGDSRHLLFFIGWALLDAAVNVLFRLPDLYSVLMWGQFFFIALIPVLISERVKLLNAFMTVVSILFTLDLFTNLLLVVQLPVPWADSPGIRPGETFPRLPGIMNSSLFSGYLSFMMIAYLLDKNTVTQKPYLRFAYMVAAIINMLFAGTNRILLLVIVLAVVRFIPAVRRNKWLLSGFALSVIAITVSLTFYTALTNKSNFLRSQLWVLSVERIADAPLLGHGLFYPDTSAAEPTLNKLAKMGVTESFILAIAHSYGLPVLLSFLVFLAHALVRITKIPAYTFPQGIFLGLGIELFFGGSLANTLFVFLFFLSFYMIIETSKNQSHAKIHA